MAKLTRTEALSHFLDALDGWGCEDNDLRAKEIIEFLDGGCDLSEYEENRPELRVIQGGRSLPQSSAPGRGEG